jgi:hypothetical protein
MEAWRNQNPCVDCLKVGIISRGDDADHIDPSKKKFVLSSASWRSDKEFNAEAAKCEGRCAYHHRKRTAAQRKEGTLRQQRGRTDRQFELDFTGAREASRGLFGLRLWAIKMFRAKQLSSCEFVGASDQFEADARRIDLGLPTEIDYRLMELTTPLALVLSELNHG